MKNKNIFDFVSGGWLYDQMDRCALNNLILEFGCGYYFTASAYVQYFKQCCDEKDVRLVLEHMQEETPDNFAVVVTAKSRTKEMNYANAIFAFVRKEKNYCERA